MASPHFPRRRAGLRTRSTAAFSLLALVLSTTLALMTYELTRRYLISKREAVATQEAVANARTVAEHLQIPNNGAHQALLNVSDASPSSSVMQLYGRWYAASIDVGRDAIPASLRALHGSQTQRQRVTINGTSTLVVAVPIGPGVGVYYEAFPLVELQATLRTLAVVLFAVAMVTTLLGALLGLFASRRVLRPIGAIADAAVSIANGDGDIRLAADDPDLAPFVHSFNDMVDALQERIARETRFASDVSHELRTPLTAIRAAIDVLDRRVDDHARPALDILRRQSHRFEQLVLDLLEISRFDSQATTALELEIVAPGEFVAETLTRLARAEIPLVVEPSTPATMSLDPRRIERVLTNLIDNADHYAGGATRIVLAGTEDALEIAVDDAGPGIVPGERALIFERFHRGDTSRTTSAPGTGLGLAIAAEHCRLHHGRLTVTDSSDGGARFLIELPLAPA